MSVTIRLPDEIGTVFVYPSDLLAGDVLAGTRHLGHRTVHHTTRHVNEQTGHVHWTVHPITNTDIATQIFAADVMVEIESKEILI